MKKLYFLAAGALLLNIQAIAQGIDVEKSVPLFDVNFVESFGIKDIAPVHPTLAMCGQSIVVNLGDGSTPVYIDPATGEKKGKIVIGDAVATGSVASDDMGNMLICNYCEAKTDFTLYKTSSVASAPEVYLKWNNENSLPIGNRLHVQGDINGDAVIVATCDGVGGVTGSKSFIRWDVKNGVPGDAAVCEFTDETMPYWIAGANDAKVVTKSVDKADGYFVGYYQADKFYHVNGDGTKAEQSLEGSGGNYDSNSCDSRPFNGVSYTALMDLSHFPQWGLGGSVYLYNTSVVDAETFSGTIGECKALLHTIEMEDYSEGGTKNGAVTGDVLIAKTDAMMGVYYISTTYLGLGGVMFPAKTSGIDGIGASDNASVEFFNLQGVRVENPGSGLYIRRQGEKVSKVIIR